MTCCRCSGHELSVSSGLRPCCSFVTQTWGQFGLQYLFWSPRSQMEMVRLSMRSSRFYSPQNLLEMSKHFLKKTAAFDVRRNGWKCVWWCNSDCSRLFRSLVGCNNIYYSLLKIWGVKKIDPRLWCVLSCRLWSQQTSCMETFDVSLVVSLF